MRWPRGAFRDTAPCPRPAKRVCVCAPPRPRRRAEGAFADAGTVSREPLCEDPDPRPSPPLSKLLWWTWVFSQMETG